MSQDQQDYADLVDKMVIMTVHSADENGNPIEGTEAELTGTLMNYNAKGGAVFKPKSARTATFYGIELIKSIVRAKPVSATLRPVGQKTLRPLAGPGARRHLADFHGYSLTALNGMSDEEALRLHGEIDHADLGHNHEMPEKAENSRATPQSRRTREEVLAAIAAA